MRKFIKSICAWLKNEQRLWSPEGRNLEIRNPTQNKAKNKQIVVFVLILVLVFIGLWFYSSYNSTGLFPVSWLNAQVTVLPPKDNPQNQTYEQVINFIRSDNTDHIPYGVGFNCVDASLKLWRNAEWKGIRAYPIIIQFVDQITGHVVVGFPTKDRGDVFIEPQNDQQIRLRAGFSYNGKIVRGFYLWDINPIPIGDSPEYDSTIIPK
ncbi:MAG: hypothetical protein JW856_02120 [Dehalococcoidales bacterium]|nr:hypothetical protein [Dehalococcoidales bacterium]